MIKKYPAVMLVTHAHGHNDGGESILWLLREKYTPMMLGGEIIGGNYYNVLDAIARHASKRLPGTIVLEAPYPWTGSDIVAKTHIDPLNVSHGLLLVDAVTLGFDPTGAAIRTIAERNGATAIGLGNVWAFDPSVANVTDFDKLSPKVLGLVNYCEQHLRLPVPYLATGIASVVDREPFAIHEQPDPTTTVNYGRTE